MSDGSKLKTAEFFLSNLETFLRGVREWKYDGGIHSAEIQVSALRLCEDAAFEKIIRDIYSYPLQRKWLDEAGVTVDQLLEVAPNLLEVFSNAVVAYMEAEKGARG